MHFDVSYLVQMVIGAFMPWLVKFAQEKGLTWLQNARVTQIAVGVVGMITALVADVALSSIGLTTSKPVTELVLIGWGITAPVSELSYRTFIKNKQNG